MSRRGVSGRGRNLPARRSRGGTGRQCRGKRRYRDKKQATAALHHAANKWTREVIPVRAYECPECKGYHLTAKG